MYKYEWSSRAVDYICMITVLLHANKLYISIYYNAIGWEENKWGKEKIVHVDLPSGWMCRENEACCKLYMLIHHIAKGKKKGGGKRNLNLFSWHTIRERESREWKREQIVRKREVIELIWREVDTRMCTVITWASEAENARN